MLGAVLESAVWQTRAEERDLWRLCCKLGSSDSIDPRSFRAFLNVSTSHNFYYLVGVMTVERCDHSWRKVSFSSQPN